MTWIQSHTDRKIKLQQERVSKLLWQQHRAVYIGRCMEKCRNLSSAILGTGLDGQKDGRVERTNWRANESESEYLQLTFNVVPQLRVHSVCRWWYSTTSRRRRQKTAKTCFRHFLNEQNERRLLTLEKIIFLKFLSQFFC